MGERDEITTEGLARRAGEADDDAFAELVRRVEGRLRMWIVLRMGPLLRSRLTEEDVLQETLLQMHRTLASFVDNGPGSLRRWMFSVAENRLRDLHKYHTAQKRDVAREIARKERSEAERRLLDRISAGITTPSSAAHRSEITRRVLEQVERLPDDQREVFVLRAIQDLTFADIAERLDRPATTLQSVYGRALRTLKDEFGS